MTAIFLPLTDRSRVDPRRKTRFLKFFQKILSCYVDPRIFDPLCIKNIHRAKSRHTYCLL